MQIDYDGDPDEGRPETSLIRFADAAPVAHGRADEVGCSGYQAWYYRFPEADWLPLAVLLALDPGETTAFFSHGEATDGPMERVYRVVGGEAELHTEYGSERLERFDLVYCPVGAAHQLRNGGTDRCWLTTWATAGGGDDPLSLAGTEPADRPGYIGEYERIMAARAERGLPLPPGEDGDYGREIGNRPAPAVAHFADAEAITMPASEKTGADERPEWFVAFDSEWFYTSDLVTLEPGDGIDFHSHLPEHEGPVEEYYWIYGGNPQLRTEYRDEPLGAYDLMYYPPGASHQIRNTGTDTVWFGAWISVGGQGGAFELDPEDGWGLENRPGYVEEFRRIMAARAERGLPLPPGVTVE